MGFLMSKWRRGDAIDHEMCSSNPKKRAMNMVNGESDSILTLG
jgi:hypothetical protein